MNTEEKLRQKIRNLRREIGILHGKLETCKRLRKTEVRGLVEKNVTLEKDLRKAREEIRKLRMGTGTPKHMVA